MTTTQLAPGTLIANPRMMGTNYGVPVTYSGDDGAMLALGHPGKRRVLAAFNAHARHIAGLSNIADDPWARAQDWLNSIDEKWATFHTPDPERGEDPDDEWYLRWCAPDAPNAQPVTWLRAR